MSIIYVLIPIAVLFVLIGLGVFFWAVRSRQFDDLDKEAYSILFENQPQQTKSPSTVTDSAITDVQQTDSHADTAANVGPKEH